MRDAGRVGRTALTAAATDTFERHAPKGSYSLASRR